MRAWVFGFLAAFVAGCGGAAPSSSTPTPTPSTWADTDAALAKLASDHAIPGMAVAVTRVGGETWFGSYGVANVSTSDPVTPDTPFMLASVSKTVVAIAVMQARDAGALELSSQVNAILPFAVDNPHVDGETLTVHHLVTHTSGIRDNWDTLEPLYSDGDSPIALGAFLEDYLTSDGAYYDATNNYAARAPGADWEYSNEATSLAGYVVETARSTDFATLTQTEIFDPLGMTATHWHLSDYTDPAGVAMPYERVGGTWNAYGQYGYPDYPCGQLRSTARDFSRLLRAVAGGGELDGSRILDAATVEEMLTPQVPDLEPTQAVFWFRGAIGDTTIVDHAGGDFGVATTVALSPDTGVGVLIFMNTDWTDGLEKALWDDGLVETLLDRGETL